MRILQTTLAAAAATSLMVASNPADAGGLGVMGTGGVRQVPAYYYSPELDQGIDWQARPSLGGGFEAILGDKDDRIMGIARFYALIDQPVGEPDLSGEEGDTSDYLYPAAHEEPSETIGVATVGIQWGVFGDPTGLQFVISSMAGTGFITSMSQEFFLLEPGAGVTWMPNDRVQVFGLANYQLRFRKRFYQGGNAVAGVRYLFD